ncbi:hypothetical protein F8M49_17260 [Rhodococcus zopfii]|uniref:Uncharacterized protein n=1 Tax=Rhodococcus zopfii TaxID=43772 RepID=A0ABU3WSB9_9NOCA|nr:hypothetical protein [Rhodococcus zopfii]
MEAPLIPTVWMRFAVKFTDPSKVRLTRSGGSLVGGMYFAEMDDDETGLIVTAAVVAPDWWNADDEAEWTQCTAELIAEAAGTEVVAVTYLPVSVVQHG